MLATAQNSVGEVANHDINVLQVITSGVSLAIALVVMIFFSQTFEFGGLPPLPIIVRP